MLITDLIIKNFGRHAALEFSCNAHVVGLLGPNGVGKSTVLDALEYAITGETRDALPSYVRYGEGNASVELRFVKHGRVGRIFRQFGRTTKRALEWDGKTLTAAKDVDRVMSGIFGADKYAIANAVFINQGMLENILFAKDADRKQMFIRLVSMAYCEQRAHVLEGKIKKISQTIVDLGPLLDAANVRVAEAQASYDEAQAVLKASPDYDQDWRFADRFVQTENQLSTLMLEIGGQENELKRLRGQLDTKLQERKAATVLQAQFDYRHFAQQAKSTETQFNEWKSIKAELTHWKRISHEIKEKSGALLAQQKALRDLNPEDLSWETVEAQFALLQPRIDARAKRQTRLDGQRAAADSLALARKNMEALPAPPITAAELQERRDALGQQKTTLSTLIEFHARQQEMAKCTSTKRQVDNAGQSCLQCVTCGLMIANPEALSQDSLDKMQAAIQQLQRYVQSEECGLQELQIQLNTHEQQRQALSVTLQFWEQQAAVCDRLVAEIPEDTDPDLVPRYEQITKLKSNWPELSTRIKMLTQEIAGLIQQRNAFTLVQANLDKVEAFSDAREQMLAANVGRDLEELNGWREYLNSLDQLEQAIRILSAQQQVRLNTKTQYELQLAEPATPVVRELAAQLQSSMLAVREELAARQAAHNAARGVAEQAGNGLRQAQVNLDQLVSRRAADAQKRQLIDDLVLLRDTLSPEGLPLAVVRYHFEFLAKLTQEALNQLDANFSLVMDPEDPLSFKFVRLDEPAHEPLPMNKLSGGQRVRLCTAFLIAVQQRLVREVGLLVLDEPSTHVDQAGVESLADLLRSLSLQLGNTETQIIVSDHHPSLRTCFGKVLELA